MLLMLRHEQSAQSSFLDLFRFFFFFIFAHIKNPEVVIGSCFAVDRLQSGLKLTSSLFALARMRAQVFSSYYVLRPEYSVHPKQPQPFDSPVLQLALVGNEQGPQSGDTVGWSMVAHAILFRFERSWPLSSCAWPHDRRLLISRLNRTMFLTVGLCRGAHSSTL